MSCPLRVLLAASVFSLSLSSPPALPPSQLRLTLGDAPSSLVASWATSNVSTPRDYRPCVQWGPAPPAPAPAPLPYSSCGNSSGYTAFGVASPALHFARLTGLAPDSAYAYSVGDARFGQSAPITFRTLPAWSSSAAAPSPPPPVWTVAVTGAMGIVDSAATMATIGRLVSAGAVCMHFHAGDSGYADNRQAADGGTHTEDVLNTFYASMSDAYASRVVGGFSIGNHEMQLGDVGTCGGSGKNGTCRGLAYFERVAPSLPTAASGGSPFYWASTSGPVRWISLSFESPWEPGSPQHAWAAEQIATVDRAATPWVVVVVHRPLYSSNELTWPDADAMRNAYEGMFVGAAGGAAGGAPAVDFILGAHVHVYERAWQVAANGTYVRQDYQGMTTPLHVVSGSAGCIEGSTPFIGAPPAWSAARFGESTAFGFVTLAFYNETHARQAFVDAHTGGELDSAWIVRQAGSAAAVEN